MGDFPALQERGACTRPAINPPSVQEGVGRPQGIERQTPQRFWRRVAASSDRPRQGKLRRSTEEEAVDGVNCLPILKEWVVKLQQPADCVLAAKHMSYTFLLNAGEEVPGAKLRQVLFSGELHVAWTAFP